MFLNSYCLYFVFPRQYDKFTPFDILTRRRHLDNTTFFVFPKRVILKRENDSANISPRKKYFIQVGVLRRPSFLFEALRLPKNLDLQRTPLQKSVPTLATMSFFHPCTKFYTKGLLVVLQTTTGQKCHSQPMKFQIPLEFMTSGLLHYSVKWPLVSHAKQCHLPQMSSHDAWRSSALMWCVLKEDDCQDHLILFKVFYTSTRVPLWGLVSYVKQCHLMMLDMRVHLLISQREHVQQCYEVGVHVPKWSTSGLKCTHMTLAIHVLKNIFAK